MIGGMLRFCFVVVVLVFVVVGCGACCCAGVCGGGVGCAVVKPSVELDQSQLCLQPLYSVVVKRMIWFG